MDELEKTIHLFISQIQQLLDKEKLIIAERTRNKQELDELHIKLTNWETDLQQREKDIALLIEKNREKLEMIERREKLLEEEKERLQNRLNNI